MIRIYARFSRADGQGGVGRWRKMYEAEDEQEARWRIGHLIPGCQVKAIENGETVIGPCRAHEAARKVPA